MQELQVVPLDECRRKVNSYISSFAHLLMPFIADGAIFWKCSLGLVLSEASVWSGGKKDYAVSCRLRARLCHAGFKFVVSTIVPINFTQYAPA